MLAATYNSNCQYQK